MKLHIGDVLFEPLSENIGEIINIFDHPDGRIVNIRWKVQDHLSHDTELFHKKVVRSIKKGDYEYTPKLDPS